MDVQWESIMIIVPHQDDEILMAAGVIYEALRQGKRVDVVMATNGDCGCGDHSKGRKRLRESLAGLGLLGLPQEHFHILGYADTGMPEEDSFLTWLYRETDETKVYPSFCGDKTYGLEEKAEYHLTRFGRHGSYCRRDFKGDLKGIIAEKLPECVITTSRYDTHGDHSALYWFVEEILAELKAEMSYEPVWWTGVVHSCAGDEKWPERENALFTCPEGLEEETSLRWAGRIRVLAPTEMKLARGADNLKYQALLRHETALEPNAWEFLMAFIKDEEIFWEMNQRMGGTDGHS